MFVSPSRAALSSTSTITPCCSSVYLARFATFFAREGRSLSSELEEPEGEVEGSRGRLALDELATGAAEAEAVDLPSLRSFSSARRRASTLSLPARL